MHRLAQREAAATCTEGGAVCCCCWRRYGCGAADAAAGTADAVDTVDADADDVAAAVIGAGAETAEATLSDLVLAPSAKRRCSLLVSCHLH